MRGAALVFIARALGIAIAYVLQVCLARWSGAYEFGLYAFAWTWLTIAAQLTPLGLNEAVLRFVPTDAAAGAWGRVKGFTLIVPPMVAATASATAVAAAGVLWVVDQRYTWPFAEPLLIGMLCVPLLSVLVLYEGIGRALGSVLTAYVPRNLGVPIITLLTAGALALSGATLTAETILLIAAASALAMLLTQTALIVRQVPTEARAARAVYPLRRWVRVALPMLVIAAAILVIGFADQIVVGFFLPPEELAVYYAASRTAQLLSGPQLALSVLTAPTIAKLHAAREDAEIRKVIATFFNFCFWPVLAMVVLFAAAGPFILSLFGAGFEQGHLVLVLLCVPTLTAAMVGPQRDIMTMTGHQDRCAGVYVLGAVAALVATLAAVPLFGAIGAAVVRIVVSMVMQGWMIGEVYRRTRFLPYPVFLLRRRKRHS